MRKSNGSKTCVTPFNCASGGAAQASRAAKEDQGVSLIWPNAEKFAYLNNKLSTVEKNSLWVFDCVSIYRLLILHLFKIKEKPVNDCLSLYPNRECSELTMKVRHSFQYIINEKSCWLTSCKHNNKHTQKVGVRKHRRKDGNKKKAQKLERRKGTPNKEGKYKREKQ